MKSVLLSLLVLWAAASEGYKILCVLTTPTRSHNILGQGVVDALLKEGHQVTWAMAYPETKKQPTVNLTVIDVSATRMATDNMNFTQMTIVKSIRLGLEAAAITARSPELRRAIETEHFDAVVTEWFVSDMPAGYAAVLQVPWIVLSSTVSHPYLEHLVDDITSTALVPSFVNWGTVPMSFFERLANSLIVGGIRITGWALRIYSSGDYEELFGPIAAARGTVLPPLSDTYNNISVLLMNSHPTIAPAQSFPPNVVDVAAFHVEENATLPKDLQKLLDSSIQGVIYFSLGSVLKVSELTADMKHQLGLMFGQLPYTVLWKSDEILKGLPSNVHVRKWFPQAGVLAHRNVKMFITHGGLLSIIEAVYHGVPLLAVPVYGDQPMNANRAAQAGFAAKVDFHAGMAREMRSAIDHIISNDSYYKTAKHLSKLFHSRPVAPSKLIAHYVELAIESKGAYHLRSNARHYRWYQRARIDQLAACAALLYVLRTAARLTRRRATGKRKTE